ncbi:MAG: YfcE family phosphodiesterase [Oscillospiraceae bacterium]|nr:YfcE family phosphodiesterase [Oscillospiraceae bacterium]
MKIVVVSDTHRNFRAFNNVVEQNLNADLFIHLGDGQNEFFDVAATHSDKKFLIVKGNCDFGDLDEELVANLETCRIYCNHGYNINIDVGVETLLEKAAYHNCEIALYGHTHVFKTALIDGIYVMNPGSLDNPRGKNPPTYGIIEISSAGEIVMNIVEYRP